MDLGTTIDETVDAIRAHWRKLSVAAGVGAALTLVITTLI